MKTEIAFMLNLEIIIPATAIAGIICMDAIGVALQIKVFVLMDQQSRIFSLSQ